MNKFDLNIEPSYLRNYATGMQNDIDNMVNELDTVTNIINNTSKSFIGIGADTIRENYDLLSKKFFSFKEFMNDYVKFLYNVADIYENQDKTLSQEAEKL